MRENGTDRDIALDILSELNSIDSAVKQINANLYSAVILTQPTDYSGAEGSAATFTVVAGNVVSYQWQVRSTSQTTWSNSGADGNQTATMTLEATTARTFQRYRCKLVGPDGLEVYTNEVKMTITSE